ncbi:MAG: tetratricopeptide repeat protein [Thermodesulfovibrionales bacterium]|nr:tetratricopeptide repeat protein [Thermodesulfovibrionales bacterium]
MKGIFSLVLFLSFFFISNSIESKVLPKYERKEKGRIVSIRLIDKEANKVFIERGLINKRGLVSSRCKPILEWLKNIGSELFVMVEDSKIFQIDKILFCDLKKDKALFLLKSIISDTSDKEDSMGTRASIDNDQTEIKKGDTDITAEPNKIPPLQKAYKFHNTKKYNEAIFHYKQALVIDPASVEIHLNLGNAYFIIGQYEKAIESYRNALRHAQEGHLNILNKIGTAYLFINDYSKAIEIFKEMQSLEPSNPEPYFLLGLTYYIIGSDEEAFNEYLKLQEISQSMAENLFDILYR